MWVVKTPLVFLQKSPKILLGNTIKFAHMSLCLIPEIFYAIDVVLLISKQLGVINSIILKFKYIQHVIASPRIEINNAIWYYFMFDN